MKSKPTSKPAWLHPASYFLLWAGVLLWVQALALSWLLLMSAGWLLLACWCSWPAMRIGLRRLLPLVVVAYVAFGWTVPGMLRGQVNTPLLGKVCLSPVVIAASCC